MNKEKQRNTAEEDLKVIGENLDNPNVRQILRTFVNGIESGQVDAIRVYLDHIYFQGSLWAKNSENFILLVDRLKN